MSIQHQFDDACWHYTKGDYARASELFESLLTQKHGPSATYYAQHYGNGEGVDKDMSTSAIDTKHGAERQ